MKWNNITILFACILISIIVVVDFRVNELQAISNLQIRYNNATDNAVSDALLSIVEWDNGETVYFNKEHAIEQFFFSLCIGFGKEGTFYEMKQMQQYVPILVVIEKNGFFVNYSEEKEGQIKRVFTKKIPFSYQTQTYQILFSITGEIHFIDYQLKKSFYGTYQEIAKQYPAIEELQEQNFDKLRRRTIITKLTNTIQYYITKHNDIAEQYGMEYTFALPVIEWEEWYRTVDDISLLAIFQGYPYGNKRTGYYNKVALSGTRLYKKKIQAKEEEFDLEQEIIKFNEKEIELEEKYEQNWEHYME